MKILFLAAEAAPFAKVGGLADVVGSLPKALRALGHDARVVLPAYRFVQEDPRWDFAITLPEMEVPMGPGWVERGAFLETEWEGVPIGLIQSDAYFDSCDRSEHLYGPGWERHVFFSLAAMQAMEELDWVPDILHAHDWHTGFVPVLLRERAGEAWARTRSVFTIHNIAYQGEWDCTVLDRLGLPDHLYAPDGVEAWGRLNFLKAGCWFADQVNTVSPRYAEEIQTPAYGAHLDGLMRHLEGQGRLHGILNGLDTARWNPAADPALSRRFGPADPSGRAACREALRHAHGFTGSGPTFGFVGRLSEQKGLDFVEPLVAKLDAWDANLIVLATGNPNDAAIWAQIARENPRVDFVDRFDEPLASRIYGGADYFLMPSRFEPCGLGQMIAMRYGAVPIVRRTGGLADTVVDGENGLVFDEPPLLPTLERAVALFGTPGYDALQRAGFGFDAEWARSAEAYADLYRRALA